MIVRVLLKGLLLLFGAMVVQQCSLSAESETEKAVIVTATSLNCRATPSVSGRKISAFVFGQIVAVSGVSDKTDTIEGTTAHWFRSSRFDCWIFGGYVFQNRMLNAQRIIHLERQEFIGNMLCGGNSCGSSFEAILVDSAYVAPVWYSDYCETPDVPCTGRIVGELTVYDDRIQLHEPSAYYWENSDRTVHKITGPGFAPEIVDYYGTLYKKADKNGLYYANGYYSKITREQARRNAESGVQSDSPAGIFFIEKNITSDEAFRHAMFK